MASPGGRFCLWVVRILEGITNRTADNVETVEASLVQFSLFIDEKEGMPNIGSLLREEISRLSRRETRSLVDSTRKATSQHRRDIAALKRQVTQLQRQIKQLSHRSLGGQQADPSDTAAKPVRFTSKGLRSLRSRLGVSQTDLGRLLGVSAQSIYNWEREAAKPRAGQLAKLSALRAVGKRQAAEMLEQLSNTRIKRRAKA